MGTPLPWVADEHQIFTADGRRVAVFGDGIMAERDDRQNWREDAARAVEATRNHEALVRALKDVVEARMPGEARLIARAALASLTA